MNMGTCEPMVEMAVSVFFHTYWTLVGVDF